MFSPNRELNRRCAAYESAFRKIDLAGEETLVSSSCAAKKPYPTTLAAHHFRTPSLCGQLEVILKLSTSFLQHNTLIRRAFAGFSTGDQLSLNSACPMSCAEAVEKPIKRGDTKCISSHGSLRCVRRARFQPAATRLQNKRLLARVVARQRQSCLTVNPSRGQSSGLQAICCIARQTPENVTKPCAYDPAFKKSRSLTPTSVARASMFDHERDVTHLALINPEARTETSVAGFLRSRSSKSKGHLYV